MITNMQPYKDIQRETMVTEDGQGQFFVFTNHVQGIPLFSWWVFSLYIDPLFVGTTLTDDVAGNMMGPYETLAQAQRAVFGIEGIDGAQQPVIPF